MAELRMEKGRSWRTAECLRGCREVRRRRRPQGRMEASFNSALGKREGGGRGEEEAGGRCSHYQITGGKVTRTVAAQHSGGSTKRAGGKYAGQIRAEQSRAGGEGCCSRCGRPVRVVCCGLCFGMSSFPFSTPPNSPIPQFPKSPIFPLEPLGMPELVDL